MIDCAATRKKECRLLKMRRYAEISMSALDEIK